jgi:hypothetical protein
MMIKTGAAVMSTVAGVAVGLAASASAAPLSGSYSAVIGGDQGSPTMQTWVFTPCGPNCTSMEIDPPHPATIRELHLQGTTWTGPDESCVTTIDNNSLAGSTGCGAIVMHVQLTKM